MHLVVTNMVRNINQAKGENMSNFIRINVGEDNLPIIFNIESIESVDLTNKRIYTIGADEPYHIYDDSSWKKIISYVSNDLNVDL